MATKKEIKKRNETKIKALEEGLELDNPIKKIIINFMVVLTVILIFYFVTILVMDKSVKYNYKEDEESVTIIQYDEIIAGETFNITDSEYFVLFYDFNGPNANYYEYISSNSAKKVYIVDIGNYFNKPYVSETSNKNVQKIEDLKVKEGTLIKIKDGKNVLYFEGELEEISEKLR